MEHKYTNDKNYCKVKDQCHDNSKYRRAAHSICNLKYNTLKKVPLVLHKGSNYDYHLIIKELAKEFDGKFSCLEENTKKHKTFSVPKTKEVKRIAKNRK